MIGYGWGHLWQEQHEGTGKDESPHGSWRRGRGITESPEECLNSMAQKFAQFFPWQNLLSHWRPRLLSEWICDGSFWSPFVNPFQQGSLILLVGLQSWLTFSCVTTYLSFLSRKVGILILHRVEVVVKWDNTYKMLIRVSAPNVWLMFYWTWITWNGMFHFILSIA